jgi:CelD/BcsL family acetyltransferase involved in cellulose biosynthesis
MEELCREGVSAVDFGIGEALYKQRFGNRHWSEGTVHLYAPTWRGMRVKALRTMAVVIDSTGKTVLKRAKLAERVKKLWRTRATKATSRNQTQ